MRYFEANINITNCYAPEGYSIFVNTEKDDINIIESEIKVNLHRKELKRFNFIEEITEEEYNDAKQNKNRYDRFIQL